METQIKKRLPDWLKRPLPALRSTGSRSELVEESEVEGPAGTDYSSTSGLIEDLGIETICTNANCPNRGECWSKGTVTVLILGNICTRSCKFCSVAKGTPACADKTEPARVAELAEKLKIKYLVITSVTRDDLPDGGAAQFRDVINTVRQTVSTKVLRLAPTPVVGVRPPAAADNNIRFELLVPDFKNYQRQALEILSAALPFVFGHNIETVPRLYKIARSGADYKQSLKLLEEAKKLLPLAPTKSSIMLGLGETDNEIQQTLSDLRAVNCDRIAIGQYLKPSKQSLDVVEYITPEKFDYWAQRAKQLGFNWVSSSPFTRSSYNADK